MNISPDYIIERKRNKSSLLKWKLFSLIILFLFILSFAKRSVLSENIKNLNRAGINNNYIATIQINDVIEENYKIIKKLDKIAENKQIQALIVSINSPGGSVVGSEMMYNSLRKISKNKPVIAVLGSVAASGGYLISLGADYIVSHNGTITGSIGVIMQSAEVTELLEKIGIKGENFKSSPLKASPNPIEKTTEESRAVIMKNVEDVYQYFIEIVSERRNLDIEYVKKIADGRIYSGREAFRLKLVDEVGNMDNALDWLYKEKKIAQDLELVEIVLTPKERLIEILFEDIGVKFKSFFNSAVFGTKSFLYF